MELDAFAKAGTILKDIPAYELGKIVVQELLQTGLLQHKLMNYLGNVIQPVELLISAE